MRSCRLSPLCFQLRIFRKTRRWNESESPWIWKDCGWSQGSQKSTQTKLRYLKYKMDVFGMSPRKMGNIPILTNIFVILLTLLHRLKYHPEKHFFFPKTSNNYKAAVCVFWYQQKYTENWTTWYMKKIYQQFRFVWVSLCKRITPYNALDVVKGKLCGFFLGW